MSKPVSTQMAGQPAPGQRAAAVPVPKRDARVTRTRAAKVPAFIPEVGAKLVAGLEPGCLAGYIWS